MSDASYEIRCPVCKTVMTSDVARCPTCAANAAAEARTRAASANVAAVSSPLPAPTAATAPVDPAEDSIAAARSMEGASTLKLKDYHRMVRANYGTVQGRGATAAFGNPLVPILLILALGLAVGAAVAFHWI